MTKTTAAKPAPQTIKDAHGRDAFVVLPVDEYRQLLEDAEDAADAETARRIQAGIANGSEELVPAELVDRIIDGENPTRVWREYRGMSQEDLAKAAEVSRPAISQIETGKTEPTLATAARIARALTVDIDDLVNLPAKGDAQAGTG